MFWRRNKPYGEKRKGEEEEEEEKEEKKKFKQGQKGIKAKLKYGIVWIYGILRLCMVNSLSPNLGF